MGRTIRSFHRRRRYWPARAKLFARSDSNITDLYSVRYEDRTELKKIAEISRSVETVREDRIRQCIHPNEEFRNSRSRSTTAQVF
jgi:hypothetical protein